jgi:uncharacterized cupin superfamily protein
MSRLDLSSIPVLTGTGYPEAFAEAVSGRSRQALGDAGGITQFGVLAAPLALARGRIRDGRVR